MIVEEIKEIRENIRTLSSQLHRSEAKLRELQEQCPHDDGYTLPFMDAYNIPRPRIVKCKICDKFIGPYCKVNPKHICEFDSPDKKAKDWHDKCIHCGKLYED